MKNSFFMKTKNLQLRKGGKKVLKNFFKYCREALPSGTAMADFKTVYIECFKKHTFKFPCSDSLYCWACKNNRLRGGKLLQSVSVLLMGWLGPHLSPWHRLSRPTKILRHSTVVFFPPHWSNDNLNKSFFLYSPAAPAKSCKQNLFIWALCWKGEHGPKEKGAGKKAILFC